MDTIMNCAGVQGLIDCQRPNVGYYIKLLHDGDRMDHHQIAEVNDNSGMMRRWVDTVR
jgi:hypothetical protein